MANDLSRRVVDHFQRQTAVFRQMMQEWAPYRDQIREDQVETVLDIQHRHTEAIERLVAECRRLADEWNAGGRHGAVSGEVRASMMEAEQAARELESVRQGILDRIDAEKHAVSGQLEGARRERGLLRKYHPQMLFDASFIDRKT